MLTKYQVGIAIHDEVTELRTLWREMKGVKDADLRAQKEKVAATMLQTLADMMRIYQGLPLENASGKGTRRVKFAQ